MFTIIILFYLLLILFAVQLFIDYRLLPLNEDVVSVPVHQAHQEVNVLFVA